MSDATGPISSLPGARHPLPDRTMCDSHPDRPAVTRVQGETDSFGCEMNDLCQECLDEERAYAKQAAEEIGRCEWCGTETTGLRETRDYDEGMYGRVYSVCGPCRWRRDDAAQEELDQYAWGVGHVR